MRSFETENGKWGARRAAIPLFYWLIALCDTPYLAPDSVPHYLSALNKVNKNTYHVYDAPVKNGIVFNAAADVKRIIGTWASFVSCKRKGNTKLPYLVR